MGRKSTGQWAYYLRAAIIVAVLTLVWQIPGSALAADTGDTWILSISVTGHYTYSDTYGGDPPAPVYANVNFNVTSQPFEMVDDGRIPKIGEEFPEPALLLGCKTPFDSETGSFTTYNSWACGPARPQCCPMRYQAKVSGGDGSIVALWVGKAPIRNYFYFMVMLGPDGTFCACWDPETCGRGIECNIRPLNPLLRDNNTCKDVVFGLDYDELRYMTSFMVPFSSTMDAICLKSSGSYYTLSDSGTIAWSAQITLNVLYHTVGKKPFPTLFPLLLEE